MELIRKSDALRAVLHNQGDAAVAAVQEIKAVDAVVHSSWSVFAEMDLREGRTGKHILVCRECGHTEKIHHSDKMPNYCQNCGAKMDGKENADE